MCGICRDNDSPGCLSLSIFSGSFIDPRDAHRDYGGEDRDTDDGGGVPVVVERLHKDVHGIGVAVRKLSEKIGTTPCPRLLQFIATVTVRMIGS